MRVKFARISQLGNRRQNEDRVGICDRGDTVLLVVADGMGGHGGGKEASRCLVDTMLALFERIPLPVAEPERLLAVLIDAAQRAIVTLVGKRLPQQQPRTTCVVCLVQGRQAWWAHVGDSRLYLLRRGEVVSRTRDHSLVEELVYAGKLTPRQAADHPRRNVITQCVGAATMPPLPRLGHEPALQADDVLLLCSDGLWNGVSDDVLALEVAEPDLEQALAQLVEKAEASSYPHADNISAVALRWLSEAPAEARVVAPSILDPHDIDDLSRSMADLDRAIRDLENNRD